MEIDEQPTGPQGGSRDLNAFLMNTTWQLAGNSRSRHLGTRECRVPIRGFRL